MRRLEGMLAAQIRYALLRCAECADAAGVEPIEVGEPHKFDEVVLCCRVLKRSVLGKHLTIVISRFGSSNLDSREKENEPCR